MPAHLFCVRHTLRPMFEELLRAWDGEEVVTRFDEPTGAWFFVGVHSTVLGPAMGGTRLKAYGSPQDALSDVLRLSGAMTLKQAAANLPYGGGKAVLAVPEVPPPGSDARHTTCGGTQPWSNRWAVPTSPRPT